MWPSHRYAGATTGSSPRRLPRLASPALPPRRAVSCVSCRLNYEYDAVSDQCTYVFCRKLSQLAPGVLQVLSVETPPTPSLSWGDVGYCKRFPWKLETPPHHRCHGVLWGDVGYCKCFPWKLPHSPPFNESTRLRTPLRTPRPATSPYSPCSPCSPNSPFTEFLTDFSTRNEQLHGTGG